jgi:hypothetical protein
MWLTDVTRGRYEVREKKCPKKVATSIAVLLLYVISLFIIIVVASEMLSTGLVGSG